MELVPSLSVKHRHTHTHTHIPMKTLLRYPPPPTSDNYEG